MPAKRQKELIEQYTQRLDKWFPLVARIFVLSLFVVHPLVIKPDTYYSIVDTKRVFFTGVLVAACLALLVLAAIAKFTAPGYLQWRGFRALAKEIRPYEWALLAYWLVMAISTIMSAYPYYALMGTQHNNEGLLMQSAYLLTVVIVGRLYKPSRRDLLALCVAAAVVSVIGIFQFYGMDFLHLNPPSISWNYGQNALYISTMSNRNILSTYLSLCFCISLILFSRLELKKGWPYLPLSWISFYMLILGDTESGYVGIAAAVLLLMPLACIDRKSLSRFWALMAGNCLIIWVIGKTMEYFSWAYFFDFISPYMPPLAGLCLLLCALFQLAKVPLPTLKTAVVAWLIILVILAVSCLLAVPFLAEATGNSTLLQAADILRGNIYDGMGSNRVFIWRRSLDIIAERPIIGQGPDNFYFAFDSRFGPHDSTVYSKAHNEYIQILVDTGIAGLITILAFYFMVIRAGVRKLRNPELLAVTGGAVCFLGQAFFNFSTPLAHPLVWCIWGTMAAYSYRGNSQSAG